MLNEADRQYHELLRKVMAQPERGDRTGTGTRSLFGHQMRFTNLDTQFPIITTKKVFFKGVKAELLWMLKGNTNIKELVDQGVNIWNDWPLKRFRKENPNINMSEEDFIKVIKADSGSVGGFAHAWGDCGPVYGYQWRKWQHYDPTPAPEQPAVPHITSKLHSAVDPSGKYLGTIGAFDTVDQVADVLHQLRTNPESRRMIIMGWNPGEIEAMKVSGLPPCHMMVQFYTRTLTLEERQAVARGRDIPIDYMDENSIPLRALDAQVYIRSNDLFLGAPFNIAQYALMIHLFANSVNMVPGELVYTIGDAHIYSNHYGQVEEQLSRESNGDTPWLFVDHWQADPKDYPMSDIRLHDYVPHASIKAPIAV